jgi:hypothetical protein
MGNYVSDKNLVKSRSLPFDPPNSAAALHQFLSQYPNDKGVKLEGAYTAPVVRIRTNAPKALDAEGRKAWSFYLLNMQQRLAGTGESQNARDAIESLLKKEPLKLSVGTLLGPLQYLMLAEQARLSSANSYVKRWFANEKLVLQLAVPHDPSGEYRKSEDKKKEALITACTILSKFSDSEDGAIDTAKIRDEAYEIGYGLTKEELEAIFLARMTLNGQMKQLESWIGPETILLLSLCIDAHGKSKPEFCSDNATKSNISNIALALKARTSTNEYMTATSPRTLNKGSAPRPSIPAFRTLDTSGATTTTASTTSATTTGSAATTDSPPKKDDAGARTTPPAKALPATPREKSAAEDRGDPDPALSGSASDKLGGKVAFGRNGGVALNLNAAFQEMMIRNHGDPEKTKDGESREGTASASVTPREGTSSSSTLSASATTSSTKASTKSPKAPSGRKRLDNVEQSEALKPRQKSDGSESSVQRAKKAKPLKRRVKSMEGRSADPADLEAMSTARAAARGLNADLLKALTDTPVYKKWEVAELALKDVLTPEMSKAVGRLMSYCHKVDLEQGKEQASLDRVVKTMRPQVKERRALIAVRDLLLAELRAETDTNAARAFPELLTLLVFAIDAERTWRQDHEAKASH